MQQPCFLFVPSQVWIGEGKLQLSHAKEAVVFFMRWRPFHVKGDDRVWEWVQEIQIAGHPSRIVNRYRLYETSLGHFDIQLYHEEWGQLCGKGIMGEKMVGWEFDGKASHFHGYEYYLLEEGGNYLLHGEFLADGKVSTQIDGKLWLKESAVQKSESK